MTASNFSLQTLSLSLTLSPLQDTGNNVASDGSELRIAHVLSMEAVLNVGLDVGQVNNQSELVI